MKTSLIALSVLSLSAVTFAQNRLLSNNEPYYVISTATHPVTGQNRIWPPTQPPEFDVGQPGVPAGTKTFKIFPIHQFCRCLPEGVKLNGYTLIIRLSAATAAGAAGIGREPANEIRNIVADPNSAGDYMPGTTVLHSIAAQPSASTGRVFRVNRTFATVTLPGDMAGGAGWCMTSDWAGGENTNVIATATQPSQGVVGSWQDGDTREVGGNLLDAFGFQYTNGNVVQGRSRASTNFYTWQHPLVEQPELGMHSDYGKIRITSPTETQLRGHSLGTYYSDGATMTTNIGYSVRGGAAFANGQAIPLVNIGLAQFPSCVPLPVLPGQTLYLKVNPGDPLFAALTALATVLSGTGDVDAVKFNLPITPGLLGYYFDWQVVVVNSTFSTIANTARRGIQITR